MYEKECWRQIAGDRVLETECRRQSVGDRRLESWRQC